MENTFENEVVDQHIPSANENENVENEASSFEEEMQDEDDIALDEDGENVEEIADEE